MESVSLFSGEGLVFILRWFHFFAGIIWIGLLYYFNFIQGAFFNETDAATKSNAIQKLVPRALYWFRHSALWTMVTGLMIIGYRGHQNPEILSSSWGICILLGGTLGTIMGLNVWFVIWPNQKVVIESATLAAQGKPALANAASAGARALCASRTNTLFSIPMLFFMGAASHLSVNITETYNPMILTGALAVIIGAIEFNALKGKTGPMTSVKGVIHLGFALALSLWAIVEFLT